MSLHPPALTQQEPAGSGMLLDRRYRLQAPIGQSAEPGSWQAFDEVLSRRVVVQCLRPGARLAAAEFAAVRAAARLTDPRIARIFDADDTGECPYLVCEHSPGQPLDQMLGAGPLEPALAAAITTDAAEALASAHAAGAPHLCLTAQSLRWGDDGLKITGLAVDAAVAGVTDTSPGAADSRALGQILYALLTGYWPGSRATLLPPAPRNRRGRIYQPWQVRAGIPGPLNDIASRALGLHPACPDPGFADPDAIAGALRLSCTARGPAVPRRKMVAAAKRRAGHSVSPWPLGDCA